MMLLLLFSLILLIIHTNSCLSFQDVSCLLVSHGVFANLSVNKSGVVTSVNCLSVKITHFCLHSPAVPYGVSKFRPLFGNLNVLALFYVSLFYVLYSSAALHPPPPLRCYKDDDDDCIVVVSSLLFSPSIDKPCTCKMSSDLPASISL